MRKPVDTPDPEQAMSPETKKQTPPVVIVESNGARRMDVRSFFRSSAGHRVIEDIEKLTSNARHLRGFETFRRKSA